MTSAISRRSLLGAGAGIAALSLGGASAAFAQGKPKVRFSCAFPETDMRAEGFKTLAAAMKDDFDFEPYWINSLFKQGTELVALQRDNLEMCNLAPADISKQIPAWSLMTSAYLFRDYDHLNKTFKSDVGKEFIKLARDQLNVEVIRPVYFGARNVNLKSDKKINTPADLAGVKLRMPPGEFWQFLGESIGVHPTPVPIAELYTALQSGAVDGQDNPVRPDQEPEVLRGHIAVHSDRPRDRLRRADGIKQDLEGLLAGATGEIPRCGRQGVRRQRREAYCGR